MRQRIGLGQIGKIAMDGEPAGCVKIGELFEEEPAEQTRAARLCPNMCNEALDTGTVRATSPCRIMVGGY